VLIQVAATHLKMNESNDPILVLKNSPQYKEANVTKFINDESFLKKIEFSK
jgi:hypothetical protein